MDKRCFIGIDGGGTKAVLSCINNEGGVIFKCEGGSTNLASNTYEDVKENITKLFNQLYIFDKDIEILSVCIGTAGISLEGAKEKIETIIKDITKCDIVLVVSDMDILLNAYKNENRVVLIAGTGSICFGCNERGEKFRTGGYGHIFSDEGSGYDIACKVFKAIMYEYDGRGKKTILTKLFLEQEKKETPLDLISVVYKTSFDKKYIANFAKLLEKALEYNDEVAFDIVDEVVNSLYSLIENAILKLNTNDNINIVFSGSVVTKNEYLNSLLGSKLKTSFNNITINTKEILPYVMACEMGKEIYEGHRSYNKR